MVEETIGTGAGAWAGITAEAVRGTAAEDGSVLVLPIASLEQHGPHLPTSTDTILATSVAHRGVEVADDVPALVLPPIWTGYSPHHLPFGGTVTLSFETMFSLIHDVADSALGNGFDSLLVLNGHGGNGPMVSAVVSTIGPRHPDIDVLGLTYWLLAEAVFNDEVRESEIGGASHGGEFETSLMLHLRPDLVRPDRFVAEYHDPPYAMGNRDLMVRGHLSTYRDWDEYSESGTGGDPTLATAEKGERLFDALGEALADLLREIHAENRTDGGGR